MSVEQFMRRPRVQQALAWLAYWLEPHIPARKQTKVTISNATLYSEPGETQPLISINGDRR